MVYFVAFLLALLVTLLFVPGYRKNNLSFMPLVIVFFILFLAGIATQSWIAPFGPVYFGIAWAPLLFIVLLITLLLAAPSPYARDITSASKPVTDNETTAAATISVIMWILFVMLLIVVFVGFLRKPAL
jgi:hypothetical protein